MRDYRKFSMQILLFTVALKQDLFMINGKFYEKNEIFAVVQTSKMRAQTSNHNNVKIREKRNT